MKLFGHLPNKNFGQNFLKNEHTAVKFVELPFAHFEKKPDIAIEIGPGVGSLTFEIAKRFEKVLCIEKDKKLLSLWENEIPKPNNVDVIEGDGCDIDFTQLQEKLGQRLWVYGNLPFNVATPILENMLYQCQAVEMAMLCFQKEVAMRITATSKDKNYGTLSLLSTLYADVVGQMFIGKGQYQPPPKVDSKVLCFKFLEEPRVGKAHAKKFEHFCRQLFKFRRKTLINGLNSSDIYKPRIDDVKEWLTENNVSATMRAEALDFNSLWQLFEAVYVTVKENEYV